MRGEFWPEALRSGIGAGRRSGSSKLAVEAVEVSESTPSEFPSFSSLTRFEAGRQLSTTAGDEAAATQFLKKSGTSDVIWADQLDITEAKGASLRYTTRLSASLNGTWVHQFYQIFAQYSHSCYASAQLIGESKD